MKNKWVSFIKLEIFLLSLFAIGLALFADRIGIDFLSNWNIQRFAVLGIGVGFLFMGLLLISPKFHSLINNENGNRKSKYIILSSGYCLLAIGLMEIILGITYDFPPNYIRTNWFGNVPKANSSLLYGKEGYALTHFDELGENHTPFSDGTNILVLGDSITQASQVNDEYKAASIAENILHKDGYTLNIRNLGRAGLAMADYVSWIPLYIKIYKPRLIIIQLSESDFIESFGNDKINYYIKEENNGLTLIRNYDVNSNFEITYSGINISSRIYIYGKYRLGLIINQDNNELPKSTLNEVLANQQMEQLLSSCNGTRIIVWLLPQTPTILGNSIEFQSSEYEKFKEFLSLYPEVTVIDPSPEFNKLVLEGHFPWGFMNSTNPSVGHLNRYGNKVVGELIAKAIENAIQ